MSLDERILAIDGWMQEPELEWLSEAPNSLPKNALVVETGTWKGRSTAALLLGLPQTAGLVTIDTWLGQADIRFSAHAEATRSDLFLEFMRNMTALGRHPRWYTEAKPGLFYLRMDTVDAAALFEDCCVDLLFVDDDHSKIARTTDAWLPKVKAGGTVAGHDYSTAFPNIMDYVNRTFADIQQAGSIWIARKNHTNT